MANTADALLRQLAARGGPALRPANAAVALLLHEDGRYIMQLRDPKIEIFYPDHWGCFGGAIDPGEDATSALRRELHEELELEMRAATRFTQFEFDFSSLAQGKVTRAYYEVGVPDSAFRRLVLHEGQDVKAFAGAELLANHRVTPYDAFAIWMHAYRGQRG
ncbi:MAG TPA: NUDIX domain-containing protein [Burkholderiales bacterium]|nr:NUDIX domain-containing protein [Burkholderiales bacterium]